VKVSGAQRKNAMVKSRFEPKTIPGYFGSFEIRKIEKSKFNLALEKIFLPTNQP
jgi:hypothetical protein